MDIDKTPDGYRIVINGDEVLYIVADKGLIIDGAGTTYMGMLIRKEVK